METVIEDIDSDNAPIRNLEELISELHSSREKFQVLQNLNDRLVSENKDMKTVASNKDGEILQLNRSIDEFRELILVLRAEIDMKENVIRSLKSKLVEFESSNPTKGVSLNDISKYVDEKFSESEAVSTLKKNLAELQFRHNVVVSDYEDAVKENNSLKLKLKDIKILSAEETNLVSKQKDTEICKLKLEINRLKEDLTNSKTVYDRNELIFTQTRESNIDIQNQLTKQSNEIRDLKHVIEQSNMERDELRRTITSHEKAITQYRQQIHRIEEDKTELIKKISSLSLNSPSSLNKEISDIRDKMSLLSNRVHNSSREDFIYTANDLLERDNQLREVYEGIIHDLHQEIIKNANSEFDKSNQLTVDAISRCKELEVENQSYEQSISRLETELTSMCVSVTEAFERNAKLQESNTKLLKSIADMKSKYDQLDRKYISDREEWEHQRSRYSSVQRQIEDSRSLLTTKVSVLEATVRDMEEEKNQLKEKDRSWNEYCKELQRSYESLESDYERLENTLSNQSNHIQQISSDYESNKHQLQNLSNELSDKTSYISSLEKQLSIVSSERRTAEQRIESLEYEIKTLKNENEKYNQDIAKLTAERTQNHLKELQYEADFMSANILMNEKIEKEKEIRKKHTTSLEVSLVKERECVNLLRTQKKVLEERVEILQQELSTFRSLDLYHMSFEKELDNLKKSTSSMTSTFMKTSVSTRSTDRVYPRDSDYFDT